MGLNAADGISLIGVIMWHSRRKKMCFYGDLVSKVRRYTYTHLLMRSLTLNVPLES